ncbi:hypothetical protein BDA96_03G410900 [Sorghum bicolor]|uniref:Uncharacterized protein n=1 Tax=Sorghum bicolor TaxID=4558 RepID=A0A921UQH6_SORBI|nr:hypothetical protein BDA96_03G410900 [Sorghum bicolor]
MSSVAVADIHWISNGHRPPLLPQLSPFMNAVPVRRTEINPRRRRALSSYEVILLWSIIE